MNDLKKFFPLSFKKSDTTSNLIVGILLYLVIGILAGALVGLATLIVAWIPLLGAILCWVFSIVSSLVGLYVLAGIVIQVLLFCKVLKD